MNDCLFFIKKILDTPSWWVTIVFVIVCIHLKMSDTFLKVWHLYHSRQVLENRIMNIQTQNLLVKEKLEKLSDDQFLEQEVRNRFNWVEEQDIIFIFADEQKKPF